MQPDRRQRGRSLRRLRQILFVLDCELTAFVMAGITLVWTFIVGVLGVVPNYDTILLLPLCWVVMVVTLGAIYTELNGPALLAGGCRFVLVFFWFHQAGSSLFFAARPSPGAYVYLMLAIVCGWTWYRSLGHPRV